MKKLYFKIVTFLLPVILVWGGLEYFYKTTETNYTFKHKKIIESYNHLEVLVLGNSHALFGINPTYFEKNTFNAANISQSLYFDELILEKHINSLPKLKVIILTISYFSLSQQDNSTEDLWRKYFYKQQMNLTVPIVSNYNIKNYSLALSRRFNKSLELIKEYIKKGTVLSCDEKGYGLQDATNIVKDKESISHIIANKHENHSLDFSANKKRLQRIITVCKQRGIDVFLVEMPVYKTYYELLDFQKKQKIISVCNELSQKNKNVSYIKLSQHPLFQDSDLRDADHLTNKGAEKCSKLIDSIINSKLQ